MNNNKKPTTQQEVNRLYDYIFSFFLGNDFLPHFPSVNIRTRGIEILFNAYKHLFAKQIKICLMVQLYFGETSKNL